MILPQTTHEVLDMRIAAVRDAVLAGKQPPSDIYRASVAVEYSLTHQV